jgi:hypothetical protein
VRRNKDTLLAPTGSKPAKTATSSRRPVASTSRAATRQTPVVDADGWTTIPPGARTAKPPKLPIWLPQNMVAELVYDELAKLPQAKAWMESEWKLLQLALPLLERYLARPGSESFKALVTSLSPALKLTADDLAKARMRIAVPAVQESSAPSAAVTNIASRRERLTS